MTNNVTIISYSQCGVTPGDENTPTVVIANYDNSDTATVILHTDNELSFFPGLASSCEGAESYLEYILGPEAMIEPKVDFTCSNLTVDNNENSYSVSCDFI